MRVRSGILTTLTLVVLLLASPGAGAQETIDPVVSADLRFAREVPDEGLSGHRGGDVDGDGQDDLLLVQDFQVTLGDFASSAEILFGRLPRGGEAGDEAIDRVAVTTHDTIIDIAPVGDVNGDGRDDLVVTYGTQRFPGEAQVLLGAATRTSPQPGFTIAGAESYEGLGDVNRDGLDDLVVRRVGGRVYVVFGKASTDPVDLDALGAGGYEIVGLAGDLRFVEAAGDFDGDGRGDVLADGVVVLTTAGPGPLDASQPGRSVRVALGERPLGVEGVGDFDGDSLDDVLVAESGQDAWVVFGRSTPGAPARKRLKAARSMPAAVALGGLGDINDDGLDDVSAFGAVVLGTTNRAPVDLRNPRSRGFLVTSSRLDEIRFDTFGLSSFPVGVGDIIGDERDDVMYGAYLVSGGTGPQGGECTITGTDDGETILGTDGDDVICGLGGNDRIRALGGDDVVAGNTGGDEIDGGDGDDRLIGGNGPDVLRGEAGDDRAGGVDGIDSVGGGLGDDDLAGGNHRDAMSGAGGFDVLDGGIDDGFDILRGADGDDRLRGGPGNDDLAGGDGNDDLDGETGVDEALGQDGHDSIVNAVRALGGNGDDQLQFVGASSQFADVNGGPGDDRIFDARGDAFGAAGDDVITGVDAGGNYLFGGDGADVVIGAGGDDVLTGGRGDDRVTDGSPTFGPTGPDRDHIHGGPGQDEVIGEAGEDAVLGGSGDDLVVGGDGRDDLTGGAGNDRLESAGDAARDANRCGTGFDTVVFDAIDAVAADCEVRNP